MEERTYVRRTRSTRRRGPRNPGPWDKPHLVLWGGLLALLLLTPLISVGPITIWTWDTFEADAARQFSTTDPDASWESNGPDWVDILRVLFPHLFGGLALALFYLCRPSRLRGQLLAAVGVGHMLLHATGVPLNTLLPAGGDALPSAGGDVFRWSLVFGILVGPPLLAAGNRVQRREEVTGMPLVLAIVGGVMILLPFFNQVEDHFVVEIFLEGDAWEMVPLLLLLLFAWFCLGLAAVSLAFPGIRHARGAIISRLIRVCLWSAPLIIIVTVMGKLGELMGDSSGGIAWFLLRMYLLYAGVVVLIAVGLARILEAPEPDEPGDIEDAVKAF